MGPDENKNNLNGFDNQVQGSFSEAQNNLSTTQNNFSAGASLSSDATAQNAPVSIPVSTPENNFSTAKLDQSRVKSFFGSYNGNRGGRSNSSVRSELDRIAVPMAEAKPKKKLNLRVLIVAVVAVAVLVTCGLLFLFIQDSGEGKTLSVDEALPILEEFEESYSVYVEKYDSIIGSKSPYYNTSFFLFPLTDAQISNVELDADVEYYEEFKNIKSIKGLDGASNNLFKTSKKKIISYIENSHKNLERVRKIYDAFIDPLIDHYYYNETKTCTKSSGMNELLESSDTATKNSAEAYYDFYCAMLSNYPVITNIDIVRHDSYMSAYEAASKMNENYNQVEDSYTERLKEIIEKLESIK